MDRLRGVVQGVALALAALLLCAGLLEVGLRLFWDGYYQKFQPDRPWAEFEFHPTRGFALGRDLEMVDWDTDFKVLRRHNSRGFRSPEIDPARPAGRTRVLAVGDSFVYGTGVENEEAYPAVLEALEPSLQVVNLGVPAYSGAEELVQLREEIGVWKPDVVVAAYFWNDLFGAYPGRYLQFELRDDGELFLNPPDPPTEDHPAFEPHRRKHEKRERRYHFVARNSYLWRLLSDRLKVLGFVLKEWRRELFPRDEDAPPPPEEDRSQEEPAWRLSLALLREMSRVANDHGARFLVLIVPDQAQVEPDATVLGLPPFVLDVQERVVDFARREGIAVLDPLPALKERRQATGEPFYHPNDRHWNATGHRQVAELLLRELRRRGWVEAS
ncbi:MAG: alginate O-acetyltransferase AlgX-related protein [Myxococcota bacterium]